MSRGELTDYRLEKVIYAEIDKMPRPDRKRRQTRSQSRSKSSERDNSDENKNDNHSKVVAEKRRKPTVKSVVKDCRKISLKKANPQPQRNEDDDLLDYEDNVDNEEPMNTVQFEEDGNIIQIAITNNDRNEFPSENEVSDDSEEEGELRDDEASTSNKLNDPEGL